MAPWLVYLKDSVADLHLTMRSASSPNGAVAVHQEASQLRATWSGADKGEIRIGGRAVDLRPVLRDAGALMLRYRVESRPLQPVYIGMRCDAPYRVRQVTVVDAEKLRWTHCDTQTGAMIDATAGFVTAQLGSWQTLTIPLACFADMRADLSNVSAQLALETAGRFDLAISEISLVRHSLPVTCPMSTTVAGHDG